jgi:hypothetical protein
LIKTKIQRLKHEDDTHYRQRFQCCHEKRQRQDVSFKLDVVKMPGNCMLAGVPEQKSGAADGSRHRSVGY